MRFLSADFFSSSRSWCWPASSSLGPSACPSWRQVWHLLSSSFQVLVPVTMTDQRSGSTLSVVSAPSLRALGCIPWGPKDPYLLMYSLTPSHSIKGTPLWPSLSPHLWDLRTIKALPYLPFLSSVKATVWINNTKWKKKTSNIFEWITFPSLNVTAPNKASLTRRTDKATRLHCSTPVISSQVPCLQWRAFNPMRICEVQHKLVCKQAFRMYNNWNANIFFNISEKYILLVCFRKYQSTLNLHNYASTFKRHSNAYSEYIFEIKN